MSKKQLEIFRLEDRVLFEAAAAAEIVEAQENDPNANMSETDRQAQEARDAVKNVPVENAAGQTAQASPSDVSDIDAEIQALIEGEIGMDEVPEAMRDAINELLNDFGANAVDNTIHDAFAQEEISVAQAGPNVNISVGAEHELVIISGNVGGKEQIVDSLGENQDVLILDKDADPFEQINAYLEASENKYNAIHIISHGSDGMFSLNGQAVSARNFNAGFWTGVGSHMADGGDIMFYGCNIAEGEAGQALVGMIADASGMDVAASTNVTGLNGDWTLEYSTGAIETTNLYVEAYSHSLQNYWVTNTNDSGVGSLRQAIANANDFAGGDNIYFDIGGEGTIVLNSVITINGKNLTIYGNDNITIKVATTYAESLVSGNASTFRIFSLTNSNLTLLDMTLKGGSITGGGGAIYAVGGTLTLDNVTISDSCSAAGGAISLDGATAVFTDCTISGNHSTAFGGGINLRGTSKLEISGATVIGNNTAEKDGGGIYMTASSTLTMTGGEISGNSARHGGGLWTESTVTFGKNVSIYDNTATGNGGGICANGATITLSEGNELYENTADGNGGSIHVTGGTLTLNKVAISDSSASNGGAISLNGAKATLTDCTISGNDSSWGGGGIYAISTSRLEIFGTTVISGNTTNSFGGGIYMVATSTLILNGGEITGNKAVDGGGLWTATDVTLGSGVSIHDNEATGNGGGIYASGSAHITLLTGNKLSGNTAKGSGGGILLFGSTKLTLSAGAVISGNKAGNGGGVSAGSGSTLILNGGEITGNTANNGGGLWTAVSVTLGSSVSIHDNTAIYCGGGIYAGGSIYVTLDGNKLDKNKAAEGGGIYVGSGTTLTLSNNAEISGNIAYGNGGGVAAASGSILTLNSGKITRNEAARGGGLYTETSVTLGSNISIYDNRATDGGGGIYAGVSAHVTLDGNKLYGNIAEGNGGGIYLGYGTTLTLSNNAEISGNTATGNGGGIAAAYGSTLILTSGKITGNTGGSGGGLWTAVNVTLGSGVSIYDNEATGNGGGIYASESAQITLSAGNKLYGNTAGGSGGGVHLGSNSKLTLSAGAEISGNSATVNGGGVSALSNSTLTLNGGEITGNEARNGGGIYLGSGVTFTLSGAIISDNTAAADGGGIVAGAGSILVLNNGEITGNTGNNGGGLWIAVGVTLGSGVSIHDNEATGNGGGIYVYGSAHITLTGNKLSGNEAKNGGGIYLVSGTQLTLSAGAEISGNTATGNGGGIYLTSGTTLTLSAGAKISGNTATGNGGGIVVTNGSTLTLNGGEITGNTGGSGGGLWTAVGVTLGSGISIHDNKAIDNGGGIFANGSAHITLTGNKLRGNSAKNGGGIYLASGTQLTFSAGAEISDNTASADGGGIAATYGSILTLNGGEITGNTANNGGGLWTAVNVTLGSGISIHDNKAIDNGGGIFAYGGGNSSPYAIAPNVTLSGNTLYENSAKNGGGIYLAAYTQLTFTGDSVIRGNKATADGGGVTATYGSILELNNGQFLENTGNNGGALWTAVGVTLGSSVSIYDNTAVGNGGGIYVYGGGNSPYATRTSLVLSNGMINNNEATYGGGVFLSSNTAFTLDSGSAIQENTATGDGGGIMALQDAILNLTSGSVEQNSAAGSGGGIWTQSSLTIHSGFAVAKNNAGVYGGGVYVTTSAVLTITDGTIGGDTLGNTAQYGGGVAVRNGAGLVMNNSLGSISHNTATGDGGGIYVASSSVLTLTAGTISDNFAGTDVTDSTKASATGGNGGGIYSEAALALGSGIVINSNTARAISSSSGGLGGGVYGESTVSVNGAKFGVAATGGSGNTAGNYGGAIYAKGALTVQSDANNRSEFYRNSANSGGAIYGISSVTVIGAKFGDKGVPDSGNNAQFGGGAIYAEGAVTVQSDANNRSEFYCNSAGTDGGAVYGASTVSVTGAKFGDKGVPDSGNSATRHGGAIYAIGAIIVGSDDNNRSEFYRNSSEYNGGAIFGYSTVTVTGAKFGDATAPGSGNYSRYGGGAIFALGVLSVGSDDNNRSEFYRNSAEYGAGGAILGYSTMTVTGAKFGDAATPGSGNSAGSAGGNGGDGGAIYGQNALIVSSDATYRSEFYRNSAASYGGAIATHGAVTVIGAIFGGATTVGSGNSAGHSGGAIFVFSALTVESDATHRSEFYRNSAAQGGGAIYANNAAAISNADFTSNIAGGNGGAIYKAATGTFTITGSTITGNFAGTDVTNSADASSTGGNGGGIYSAAALNLSSNVVINNNTARANGSGKDGKGGGIYGADTVTLTGMNMSGNHADVAGGAVYGVKGVTVKGGSYTSNTTDGKGGAIYGEKDVSVSNGTFTSNSAELSGGAVYAVDMVDSSRSTYTANIAKNGNSGGGIYSEGSVNIANDVFTGNQAQKGNGGAVHAGGNATITHSEFRQNTAALNGGSVYAGGLSVNMDNTLIVDGSAGVSGGGIYLAATSVVAVLTNLTIANNVAAAGGGIYANGGSVRVENSILWGNKAGGAANQYFGLNEALVFNSGIEGWAFTGNGNINLEADNTGSESGKYYVAFENLKTAKVGDRDYHLSKASFAINRGNNAYVADGEVDLDGKARIQMGIVDMGAYESGNKGNLNVTVDAVGDTIIYGNEGSVGASLLGIDSSVSGKFIFEAADGTYIELTGAKVLAIKAGGNVTVTATFKVDGDLWNDVSGTATVITLVRQLTITGDSTVPDGITYDGQYHDYSYTVGPKTANTGLVFGDQITGIDKGTNSYRNADTYSNLQSKAVINGSADDTANYDIIYVAGTVIINQATLVVNREGIDKVYNGNTDAQYNFTGFGGGYVDGDNITYNRDAASASFGDKNVGENKAITITGEVIGGSDLGNYIVTYSDVNANITQATLVVNREGIDKVYNGNTDAQYTFTGFGGGYVDGDELSYVDGSGSFADKNVGENKAITITGESVIGRDLGNYIVTYSDVDADITQATLVVNREGIDKVYNGNTDAQYTFTGFGGGYVDGDNITYNRDAASASFGDKNVGENKVITITGEVIGGTDLGNYIVTYSDVDANITQATLVVNREGINKVYNGNTDAQYNFTGFGGGYVDGDELSYVDGSGSFADKNVGENKAITINGESVIGRDLGNYIVTYSDVDADITKATLTITGASDHFTYDSQTYSYSWTSQNGLIDGDRITDATVNGFRNAGTHSNALTDATIRDAANADMTGNYELVFVDGTVIIDKAVLVIDRTGVDKVYDGTTKGDYNTEIKPFDGDKVYYDKGTATFTDRNVGDDKVLVIDGDSLYGDDLDNYDVTFTDPTASITPAKLIIVIDDKTKAEGQADPKFTGGVSGLVDGDSVDGYNRTNKGETEGKYGIDQYQVNDGNGGKNYSVEVHNGTLTITGEARINIYSDASSRNYVINGMDEASLIHNVMSYTANREADAVLDTETSGNHHGVSHQSATHAGEKAKSNLREDSQKKMFDEADQKVVQQRTHSALKTDIFSDKSEKSIVESQYKTSGSKDGSKVVVPESGYSSQNTSFESDHPMHTMPSQISIEVNGVNVVNFSSADLANATVMEKADNLKDKLDIILEEMLTV